MKATATKLNKHPGKYLNHAIKKPVLIEKAGHPVAIMVSYERYLMLEDVLWGVLAGLADKNKTLGVKKSRDFLL